MVSEYKSTLKEGTSCTDPDTARTVLRDSTGMVSPAVGMHGEVWLTPHESSNLYLQIQKKRTYGDVLGNCHLRMGFKLEN